MDLVNIAARIRACRLKRHLTVEQLAMRANLSKGYISRLENFRTTASLKALNQIAEGLGMELLDLMRQNEETPPEFLFGHLEAGEQVERNQASQVGMAYYALAFSKTDRIMEPFLIRYRPAESARSLDKHDSEEFFVLLSGEVVCFIGSEENGRTMKPGDTLYLGKNIAHVVRLAPGCPEASALVVYSSGDGSGES